MRIKGSNHGLSWETWLKTFKTAAGRINSELAPDENGYCLFDFLKDEQFKEAFKDGVDPKLFAIHFAKEYRVSKF